jgi:hypothetical protein|tara:strand:- start:13 stop:663 length:651 start_codon:yes stop_codon:yes gene_type:complete
MKKYSFKYIKKNLNLEILLDMMKGPADGFHLMDHIIWSCTKFTLDEISEKLSKKRMEWRKKGHEMRKNFYRSIKGTFAKELYKSIYDGSLLPKISNNFKQEICFELSGTNHSLISSKKDKTLYYYNYFGGYSEKKKINLKVNRFKKTKKDHLYIREYFKKKKMDKKKFFDLIVKLNKRDKCDFTEAYWNKDHTYNYRVKADTTSEEYQVWRSNPYV